jgi:hypothetical protein
MIATRLSGKVLLAVACCLVIILLPVSGNAQLGHVVKKGAQGVQKGVETGVDKTKEGAETVVDKTKEGAETVGKEVKKTVTGEDTNTTTSRMKSTDTNSTTEPSQATAAPATTGSTSTSNERSGSTRAGHAGATGKRLPATGGELPLLALIGSLALAASTSSKLVRRRSY